MSATIKYTLKNQRSRNSLLHSVLQWADSSFPFVCALNSNSMYNKENKGQTPDKDFDFLMAVGGKKELLPAIDGNFELLKSFLKKNKKEIFGFLTYDLKNELENLSSENPDGIKMPLIHFFVPEYVFDFKGMEIIVHSAHPHPIKGICHPDGKEVINTGNDELKPLASKCNPSGGVGANRIKLKPRISKKDYIKKVNKIKAHIQRGDIYEMNYCQEFFAENTDINPVEIYHKLNEISPMPFSCFYKLKNKYLLCASPERFLKKTGNKIISQPIKGTICRGKNKKEDELLIRKLFESKKEQSENVMIVDLVRNDLSKIASIGTVKVEELCGVYSFKHLHQMISTISCELNNKFHFVDSIKSCFPMGSMTGAPKVKAMELIEKYESTKRGLFSGAVGYCSKDGNFDFNVVIRSIIYDAEKKYISVMAGSALTAESNPEKEYEECMLKLMPMFSALGTKTK